jgi:invasion protein IalB
LGGALPAREVGGEARRVCEVAQTVTAAGRNAPLRPTLALPANVSFPGAPKIAAAGDDPAEPSWRQCAPAGCFADAAFGAEALRAFRKAKMAKAEWIPAGGAFKFAISRRGLPQALDALAREP